MYPILYSNSLFSVTALGFFCTLALLLFVFLVVHFSALRHRDLQFFYDSLLFIFLPALVFGRWQVVLENWSFFETNLTLAFYAFWAWGVGVVGALLGAVLGLFLACYLKRDQYGAWLDVLATASLPALALVFAGTFLDGTLYGSETWLPWGVTFENPMVDIVLPLHPLQIYYLLLACLSFWLARWGSKNYVKQGTGGVFGFGAFAVGWFLFEYLRGDVVYRIFGLRAGQLFAIMLLIVLLVFYFWSDKLKHRT